MEWRARPGPGRAIVIIREMRAAPSPGHRRTRKRRAADTRGARDVRVDPRPWQGTIQPARCGCNVVAVDAGQVPKQHPLIDGARSLPPPSVTGPPRRPHLPVGSSSTPPLRIDRGRGWAAVPGYKRGRGCPTENVLALSTRLCPGRDGDEARVGIGRRPSRPILGPPESRRGSAACTSGDRRLWGDPRFGWEAAVCTVGDAIETRLRAVRRAERSPSP